jgi:hypothetical protein
MKKMAKMGKNPAAMQGMMNQFGMR